MNSIEMLKVEIYLAEKGIALQKKHHVTCQKELDKIISSKPLDLQGPETDQNFEFTRDALMDSNYDIKENSQGLLYLKEKLAKILFLEEKISAQEECLTSLEDLMVLNKKSISQIISKRDDDLEGPEDDFN